MVADRLAWCSQISADTVPYEIFRIEENTHWNATHTSNGELTPSERQSNIPGPRVFPD